MRLSVLVFLHLELVVASSVEVHPVLLERMMVLGYYYSSWQKEDVDSNGPWSECSAGTRRGDISQ